MFFEHLQQYWIPYTISNAIIVVVLALAWMFPKACRIALGIIFMLASIVNTTTVIGDPLAYQTYGEMALLDAYREFIDGWFSTHSIAMVLSIAAGQFLISIGMFLGLKTSLRRIAIFGIVIFGIAIAPLGVGSAFPFSILMAVAAILLWNDRDRRLEEENS